MKVKVRYGAIGSLILLSTFSCTWEQMEPEVDCSVLPVEATLFESSDAGCGTANGSFTITASGGEPPYEFTSGVGTNADGVFTNIAAGNYTVVVTDSRGCAEGVSVSIQNLDGVNLEQVVSDQSGCGATSGSIEVAASGGEEPYTYSLNGGAPQSSNEFSGLDHGSYTVSVRDQLGCEVSESVEILTGISYESSIKGIIANNCSGCHPSFTSYSTLKSRANAVKSRTGSRDMPRGSSLSQEQIDMIACWVDDGALQN